MKLTAALTLLALTLVPATALAVPNPARPDVKTLASCELEMFNQELTIKSRCNGYTFKQVDANHQTYTFVQIDYKGNPYGNYFQAHLVRSPCAGNNGFEIESVTYHPASYSPLKNPVTNQARSENNDNLKGSSHFCNPWTDDGRKMDGEGYRMGQMVRIRAIVNEDDVERISEEYKAADAAKALRLQQEGDSLRREISP
jgi:hypothetical protein